MIGWVGTGAIDFRSGMVVADGRRFKMEVVVVFVIMKGRMGWPRKFMPNWPRRPRRSGRALAMVIIRIRNGKVFNDKLIVRSSSSAMVIMLMLVIMVGNFIDFVKVKIVLES